MKKLLLTFFVLGILAFGIYQRPKTQSSQAKAGQSDSNRMIASENHLSDIDSEILSINDQKSLRIMILKIIKQAQESDINSERGKQLIAYSSIVSPLAHLESILWRMRPIIKKSGYLHYQAIKNISKIYRKKYLYGEHVSHIMDFFTHSSEENVGVVSKNKLEQFESMRELQDFTYTTVAPSIKSAIRLINKVLKDQPSWSFKINLDLFAGNNIFSNKKNLVIHSEYLYYLRARYHRALGFIEAFNIYNLDDSIKIVKKIVRKTSFENIFKKNGLPEVLSPYEKVEIIKKQKNFLTSKYKLKEYRKRLAKVLAFYEWAMRDKQKAYNLALELNDEHSFFPKEILKLNKEKRKTKHHEVLNFIDHIKNKTPYTFIDLKSGQEVVLQPSALLSLDMDLKKYLPNEFNTQGGRSSFKSDSKTRLNYNYGQPTNWPDPSFNGFFTATSGQEVYDFIGAMKMDFALSSLTNLFPVP